MTAGTAHIFTGNGNLIVSADTAYDRQLLIELVLTCVQQTPIVKVRADHTTWLVDRPATRRSVCGRCAKRVTQLACRHPRSTMIYCIACALGRPQLTMTSLAHLPATTVLRDVQAHSAYGGEWIPWTRWPQATPTEIIEDMRLQRRFAPVLVWQCAEIRRPLGATRAAPASTKAA